MPSKPKVTASKTKQEDSVLNETTNGGELPLSRQAAVEQGLTFYQETAAERDRLAEENAQLKTDIAGYKVALDATQAQLLEAQSRTETAILKRDQAIADRCKYEALFIAERALHDAFQVPTEPLVKAQLENVDEKGGA